MLVVRVAQSTIVCPVGERADKFTLTTERRREARRARRSAPASDQTRRWHGEVELGVALVVWGGAYLHVGEQTQFSYRATYEDRRYCVEGLLIYMSENKLNLETDEDRRYCVLVFRGEVIRLEEHFDDKTLLRLLFSRLALTERHTPRGTNYG